MKMQKLINTEKVPAALDRALAALARIRADYTSERSDLSGSNQTGDVAYLNAAHDCLIITRQLQHDMLQAAADVVGQPTSTFDIPCIMEMEGPDVEILAELRGNLETKQTCFHSHTYPKSSRSDRYPPAHTDHLRVANGGLV
jgi:hypothetical protein